MVRTLDPHGPTTMKLTARIAVLAVAGLPLPLAAQQITVGENVRVSTDNGDRPHYELHLAAHPSEPGVLLGAGMSWIGDENKYAVVAYRSTDGGDHWTESTEIEREGSSMDPAVAFGPEGEVYLVEFGYDGDGEGEMLLHRSADAGATWLEPTEISGMDRPFVSVAPAEAEHEGRVYVHGTEGTQPLDEDGEYASGVGVLHSSDRGATIAPRVNLHTTGDRYVLGMGNSTVLSDGTLVILYGERREQEEISPFESVSPPPAEARREANADLKVLVSDDGGENFEKARLVSEWYSRFGRGPIGMVPTLAVDRSEAPFHDRLYATWTDYRTGSGRVLLAYSDDAGTSWSDPIVVNRDGGPAFHPVVAVNGNGVVGVMWYDRRDSQTGMGWSVRFAASLDGGETVTSSVPVSEAPFRYSWDGGLVVMSSGSGGGHPSKYRKGGLLKGDVVLHHFNDKGGDTAGMAADAAGRFHPFWIDNRTSVPQIWTAAVEVTGEAVRHGAGVRTDLEDVTSKTQLVVERTEYDPETGMITVNAKLKNTSPDTLQGPFALRFRDLWSEFGEVELVETDAGGSGPGAVLQLGNASPKGGLLPDSSTTSFPIRAKINSPRNLAPFEPPAPGRRTRGGYSLFTFDARALAKTAERSDQKMD